MRTMNDRVIAITARRPMFRPALVKEAAPASPEPVRRGSYADHAAQFPEATAAPTPSAAPDPALVLRWLEYMLNDPYEMIAVLRASKPGTFGTAAFRAATALAATGKEPPCRK